VRTSDEPKKQDGISFLCVDMTAPGVTVRPIVTIDGSHYLNEVTFENVETAVDNRIGEEGRGWSYNRQLLSGEPDVHIGDLGGERALSASIPAPGEFAGQAPDRVEAGVLAATWHRDVRSCSGAGGCTTTPCPPRRCGCRPRSRHSRR